MAYTLSPNLRLRLDSNLTANAKYNLLLLDSLASTATTDATGLVRIRGRTGIQLTANDPAVGGSGVGGTITLGYASQPLDLLQVYATQLALTGSLSLGDRATGAPTSSTLTLEYNSLVPDTLARTLTLNVLGANRQLNLGGSLSILQADVALTADPAGSDLQLPATGTLATLAGVEVLTNKTIDANSNSILYLKNANVDANAAIAYSKLNLANSLVNSDVSPTAAIQYSKLALTGSLVNADVAAGAAIAYSKLALTGSIVNADVSASAAISGSKVVPAFGPQTISGQDLVVAAGTSSTRIQGAPGQGANWTLTLPPNPGTANQILTTDGNGTTAWTIGGGSVTSIDVAAPSSIMTSSGGPVTHAGVISLDLTTQTAATVWAGPVSGSAAQPTFRSLQLTDLPPGLGYITSVSDTPTIHLDVTAKDLTASVVAGSLDDSHVSVSAGISATKLGAGTVDNTELGYLDGVTGPIQTQLGGKQPSSADLSALAALSTTGLIVRTGSGTASTVSLTAGAGLSGSNLDGVAGSPTLAVDIHGQTSGAPLALADELLVYSVGASALRKATVQDILAGSTSYSTDWVTADGTTKSVPHSLNTLDVSIQVYDKLTGETISLDSVARVSTSQVDLVASSAPSASGWRVLILSAGSLSISSPGTVTSVGLSAPSEWTVGGSPVTGAGTLTLTKASQSAGTVWAGPTSGGAAQPAFRSLVDTDIPSLSGSYVDLSTVQSVGGTKTFTSAPVLSSLTPSLPLAVDGAGTVTSRTLVDADVAAGAAIALSKLAALTASRAVVSDGSGILSASATTSTEVGYLSGVTGPLQTQLNGKQATLTPGNLTSSTTGVTVTGGTGVTVGPNASISVQTASGSQPGLLSAADWTSFNSRITPGVGAIVNADVGASAAIDGTKVSPNFGSQAIVTSGNLSAAAHLVTGTGGAGYAELIAQSSTPATPAGAVRLFADSSNRFSWVGPNGFVRTLDGTGITASRVYTLPDTSDTLVAAAFAQTLTNKTINPANNTITLASGNILVGSAGGAAASVAMSGGATISNTGAVTLTNASVTGQLLTGYSRSTGTVGTSDSILTAIGHLDADMTAQLFGDGSDGDVTLAGALTLARDMYYNNLTLTTGALVNTAAYRIFVKGTLDLSNAPANALFSTGGNGVNSASSAGGAAGAAVAANTLGGSGAGSAGAASSATTGAISAASGATNPGNGGSGGQSGAGGTGAGGAGGAAQAGATASNPLSFRRWATEMVRGVTLITSGAGGRGGSGGGGSGTVAGGGGGGGGAGGGTIYIAASSINRGASTAANAINANGGNGGNGFSTATTNAGGGSGAGGGGGGWVYVAYRELLGTGATNTITASGGTGGNGGNGNGTGIGGAGGTGGAGGRVILQNVLLGTGSEVVGTSGTAGGAAVGTAGGAGGAGGSVLVGL